jgi:nickel transport system ATP-binding protein
MQQGRIVEQAEVHQLFDHPQDEYTKMLLHVRPKLSLRGINQVGG